MDLRVLVTLAALVPIGAPPPGAGVGWAGAGEPAGVVLPSGTDPGAPLPAPGHAAADPVGRPRPAVLWQSPVRPIHVLRRVALPAHPWLPGHRGVDLHAAPGTPVHAAGAGRVTFAGPLAGRGVVVVDHGTLRTTYEPVDAAVAVGTYVRRGNILGTVTGGSGHCGSGACLHWGLRRGREYLDPMLLIGSTHAWLRPW